VTLYALSIKQPWAALLVHGRKTIEVRRWSTSRRGLILIHAARVPDPRPEAWKHVGPELESVARLKGGILGAGILSDCLSYRTLNGFVQHQNRHLNEPDWFEEKGLFGLVFEKATPLAFHPVPGNVKFFTVEAALAEQLPEAWRATLTSSPKETPE
jgi:hypothetical protein